MKTFLLIVLPLVLLTGTLSASAAGNFPLQINSASSVLTGQKIKNRTATSGVDYIDQLQLSPKSGTLSQVALNSGFLGTTVPNAISSNDRGIFHIIGTAAIDIVSVAKPSFVNQLQAFATTPGTLPSNSAALHIDGGLKIKSLAAPTATPIPAKINDFGVIVN